MKVFIVGGTGFLGYYATLEFLKRGHEVDTMALPDIPLGDWFPKDKVGVSYGNVFEMSHDDLVEVFKGYDAMVYAVGPDDRIIPKAPAYDFFHFRKIEKLEELTSELVEKRSTLISTNQSQSIS